MSNAWYYAEAGKSIGPFTKPELERALAQKSDWGECLVWNTNFKGWRQARSVAELGDVQPIISLPHSPPPSSPATSTQAATAVAAALRKANRLAKVIAIIPIIGAAVFAKIMISDIINGNHRIASTQLEARLLSFEKREKSTLPKTISDGATLVDVRSLGSQLTYVYEISYSSKELPKTEDFAELRKSLVKNTCALRLKEYLQFGASFVYQYNDLDGRRLGEVHVDKSDCK